MKIMVYNVKGGQGKTDIALNLALTMDFNLITNEPYSPVDKVLEEGRYIKLGPKKVLPTIPDKYNIIYDFGGYLDSRATAVLKQVDKVIVPVVNEYKDVHTTINFLREAEKLNQNIIIVANKTKKNDFNDIQEIMAKFYPHFPIVEIKSSRAMPNILKHKCSIEAMVKKGGLNRYNYQKIKNQFDELIKKLEA